MSLRKTGKFPPYREDFEAFLARESPATTAAGLPGGAPGKDRLMRRSSRSRNAGALAALVLTAVLAAPAGAAPRSFAGGQQAQMRLTVAFCSAAFDWLVQWLLTGNWGSRPAAREGTSTLGAPQNEGCIADPSGRCAGRTSPGEAGCIADPNGRCVGETTFSENGCGLDPNGHCNG